MVGPHLASHCTLGPVRVCPRPCRVLFFFLRTCPVGLIGICLLGNFFRKTQLVILVQKHWAKNVTVNKAHVTLFGDLAWSQRDCSRKSRIRVWMDLNCLPSKSQVFPTSADELLLLWWWHLCSALWIMWVLKRFAPFEQWFIRGKCLFSKRLCNEFYVWHILLERRF